MGRCLILVVRPPGDGMEQGGAAGEKAGNRLHSFAVADTVRRLSAGDYSFKVAFCPPGSREQVVSWLGEGYRYISQRGEDLGERMEEAFRGAFEEGFEEVVLARSDVAELNGGIIEDAFKALRRKDSVVGPTDGGGYYLIGLKAEEGLPDIFRGILWGTCKVFFETMAGLARQGRHVHVLPTLQEAGRRGGSPPDSFGRAA